MSQRCFYLKRISAFEFPSEEKIICIAGKSIFYTGENVQLNLLSDKI